MFIANRIFVIVNNYNSMVDSFLYASLGRFLVYYTNMYIIHLIANHISQNLPTIMKDVNVYLYTLNTCMKTYMSVSDFWYTEVPKIGIVIHQAAAYAAANEKIILMYMELAFVILRCVFMVLIGYEMKKSAEEMAIYSKKKSSPQIKQ